MRLHNRACGQTLVLPRHHFLQHVWRQPVEGNIILDCFVHGHKRQAINCGGNRSSTPGTTTETSWRQSRMRRCLAKIQASALLDPTNVSDDLSTTQAAECLVANRTRYQFVSFSVGDTLPLHGSGFITDVCDHQR